jgi:CHAD domain-containing protein
MARVLLPPAGTSAARVRPADLAEGLGVAWDAGWNGPVRLLDTADRRLRTAGWYLMAMPGRTVLRDHDGGDEAVAEGAPGPVPGAADRWPAGPLRERLRSLAGRRALLAVADGEGEGGSARPGRGSLVRWTRLRIGRMDRLWLESTGTRWMEPLVALGWRAAPSHPAADLTAPAPLPTLVPGDATLPAQRALADLVRAVLARLADLEPGIRDDLDDGFLHEHRVILRRARALAGQFRHAWGDGAATDLRTTLAEWQRRTNRLRDLDVWLAQGPEPRLPTTLASGWQSLHTALAAERAAAQAAAAAALADPRHDAERERLLARAAHPGAGSESRTPIGRLAARRTWRAYRVAADAARGIGPDSPAEAVHAVRLACKKLRYLAEYAGPLVAPEAWLDLREDLRRLQDGLGAFNDGAVQRDGILDLGRRLAGDPDALLAAGAVAAIRQRALDEARDGLADGLARLAADSTRRRWRAAFRSADG